MGMIDKNANLYMVQPSGKVVLVCKAPLRSLVKGGTPTSKKYPG